MSVANVLYGTFKKHSIGVYLSCLDVCTYFLKQAKSAGPSRQFGFAAAARGRDIELLSFAVSESLRLSGRRTIQVHFCRELEQGDVFLDGNQFLTLQSSKQVLQILDHNFAPTDHVLHNKVGI